MDTGEKINRLRLEQNMTLEELGDKVGVGKSTVRKWEKGIIANMKRDKIAKIAEALGTTPAYLMGWDEPQPAKTVTIPVLGRVAAGIPIDAVELIIGSEDISERLAETGDFFALRIKGDSMEPDIHDGDTVIVRKQDDAESDEIVIALVNGNDGVCKRLKKYNDSIALVSNNSNYAPMYFSRSEIDETPVKVIGRVIEIRRKL
ncbi:MAG: LexA family transcriptional regulator [Oscillospiraceae bacterium]|nr:LexA family transcriptional regulator [Oscillospiraceae bacterium]